MGAKRVVPVSSELVPLGVRVESACTVAGAAAALVFGQVSGAVDWRDLRLWQWGILIAIAAMLSLATYLPIRSKLRKAVGTLRPLPEAAQAQRAPGFGPLRNAARFVLVPMGATLAWPLLLDGNAIPGAAANLILLMPAFAAGNIAAVAAVAAHERRLGTQLFLEHPDDRDDWVLFSGP